MLQKKLHVGCPLSAAELLGEAAGTRRPCARPQALLPSQSLPALTSYPRRIPFCPAARAPQLTPSPRMRPLWPRPWEGPPWALETNTEWVWIPGASLCPAERPPTGTALAQDFKMPEVQGRGLVGFPDTPTPGGPLLSQTKRFPLQA